MTDLVREGSNGMLEYWTGEYWVDERWICHRCLEQRLAEGRQPREAEERFSLDIYAGKYCDECWDESGYRKEGYEGFNPLDAGEAYWEDEY